MSCFANLEQVNGETNNSYSVYKKIDFHIILYHLLFSVFSYHKHLLCNLDHLTPTWTGLLGQELIIAKTRQRNRPDGGRRPSVSRQSECRKYNVDVSCRIVQLRCSSSHTTRTASPTLHLQPHNYLTKHSKIEN